MDPILENQLLVNRRHFFGRSARGIGAAALLSLMNSDRFAADSGKGVLRPGGPIPPQKVAKAKRVIYLFQSGGPSQLDLYDYKPQLKNYFGKDVPRSVYPDERKTTMTSAQATFATAPSLFHFKQYGRSGTWLSELLSNLGTVVDDLCIIPSMYTDAINHDPAITFFQTGSAIPGRPSIGSWLSYGLGSEAADLPAFVAMSSRGRGKAGQPLYNRLWGSGFLPSRFQGVKFRNQGAPVLDIYDPGGVDRETRRTMLNHLAQLNRMKYEEAGDPEIQTRISQYELAYRMQDSVPKLLDFSDEPKHILEMYGRDIERQGTYAYNCLIARRLAERGVRFIQLFHQGWDQHVSLPKQIRGQSLDTDQPTAALLRDLKHRGMLDDTLVVWGGEFGRTVYSQGKLTARNYGRDHHPGCFTVWMAGGGVKGGMTYGKTDDFSANVAENGVQVHDLHATILHLLGIDHKQLTYRFQGRDYRLTDVYGNVVDALLQNPVSKNSVG